MNFAFLGQVRSLLAKAGFAGGTITRASLASSSASTSGPYTTASQSPGTNKLELAALIFQVFGGGTLPTGCALSGNGLTWAEVDHYTFSAGDASVWLFRAMGTGSAGALTITPSGDASLKLCQWHVEEFSAVDTSGTNGSGAVVQSARGTDGSANPQVITYTLAALGDAVNNATFAFAASGSLVTPSNTELVDRSAADYFMEAQWTLPGNAAMTATAATAFQIQGGIAVEIKPSP